MLLIDFINKTPDAFELLQRPPLSLQIVEDYPYFILSTTIDSDLENPLCQQANGYVVRKEENGWTCVCYGAHNPLATKPTSWDDTIQPTLLQAIDGLLVNGWYDEGYWHFSTRTSIDIYNINVADTSLGTLVEKEVCNGNFNMLTHYLSPFFTYIFYVTSPHFTFTCNYGEESKLWFWSKRNMQNYDEDLVPPHNIQRICHIPHQFTLDQKTRDHLLQRMITEEGECGFTLYNEENYYTEYSNSFVEKQKRRGSGYISMEKMVAHWQSHTLPQLSILFPFLNLDPLVTELGNLESKLEKAYFNLKNRAGNNKMKYNLGAAKQPPLFKQYLLEKQAKETIKARDFLRIADITALTSYLKDVLGDIGYGIDQNI